MNDGDINDIYILNHNAKFIDILSRVYFSQPIKPDLSIIQRSKPIRSKIKFGRLLREICPMAVKRTPLFQPNDSPEIRHLRFYVLLTVHLDTSV